MLTACLPVPTCNQAFVLSTSFPQSLKVLTWRVALSDHFLSLQTSLHLQAAMSPQDRAVEQCWSVGLRSALLCSTSRTTSKRQLHCADSAGRGSALDCQSYLTVCTGRGQSLSTPAEASHIKTSLFTETKKNTNSQNIKYKRNAKNNNNKTTQKTEVTHCG